MPRWHLFYHVKRHKKPQLSYHDRVKSGLLTALLLYLSSILANTICALSVHNILCIRKHFEIYSIHFYEQLQCIMRMIKSIHYKHQLPPFFTAIIYIIYACSERQQQQLMSVSGLSQNSTSFSNPNKLTISTDLYQT